MKHIVRATTGLVLAATIATACTATREPTPTSAEHVGETKQAISGAAMTWPGTWTPLTLNGTNLSDPTGDAQGSRDVVGTPTSPAAYVSADANRLFFRMRIGSTPLKTATSLNPFGWACELDVDANQQTYEFIANVNGIVQGDAVTFSQNTTQGTIDSPADKAELTLQTYSALVDNAQNSTPAHGRVLSAGTNLGGTGGDFFIDWAVDLNDFPNTFNPLTTPFRLICGSSSNAQNISSDPVSASSATTVSGLVSDPVACSATGCARACFADTDCAGTEFCNTQTHVCAAKLVNGTSIPTVTGHTPTLNGTCTTAVGTAVCVAGICDTADNRCGYANGDGPCTSGNGATVCRSGICSGTGVCTASACTSDAQCNTSTQFCDTAATNCTPKLANGTAIPTIAGHTPVLNGTCSAAVGTAVCTAGVCDTADNRCGYANGDGTCNSGNAATLCRGGACSPNANKCMPPGGCVVDADCPSTQYCDNAVFACTPKLINGAVLPTIAGHSPTLNGTCTQAAATAVCAAGVCDTTDNRCGYADGDGTCTSGNATTVCRSGLCSVAGVCIATGACAADGDCATNEFCNTQTKVCVTKLTNGTSIPTITGHTPPLTGACNTAVGTAVCEAAVCDTKDNRCGYANGDGPCTVGDAATVCRSGACSATGGACMPAGGCVVDADCTATQYCDNSVFTCKTKLANGVAIPTIAGHDPALNGTCTQAAGSAVCTAGVCDTADNKCGYADGNGSCNQGNAGTVCRSGVCSNNGVCAAPGGCSADADCASTQFCNTSNSTCVAKLQNGTAIPTITGHTPALTGTCTTAVGTAVCASAVCSTTDNQCGKLDGDGCTSGTECRSGICNAGGTCGNATDAGVDSGPGDAGTDAAEDAGADAEPDATTEDAGSDASTTDASKPDSSAADATTGDASGNQTTPGEAGTPASDDQGVIEGGGISCAVQGASSQGAAFAWSFGAIGLAALLRRRRR